MVRVVGQIVSNVRWLWEVKVEQVVSNGWCWMSSNQQKWQIRVQIDTGCGANKDEQ